MTRRSPPEEYDDGGGPLFGDPPHNKTRTSIAAAASKRSSVATERFRVISYIRSCPNGATREEIEDGLGMPGNTVRPRVWELLGNSGHARQLREGPTTRRTRSGRQAFILWAI